MKILTNLKFITVTLFKEIVAAYRKPPVIFELVPEPACGPEMSYRKPPRTYIYIYADFPCFQ
jgi:hypothetical protein